MELKITEELIDNYIKYVCIYRVKSGYKAISEIKDEKTEKQLKEDYKIGGIQKWLADKLKLSLDELGTLESDDKVLEKKEEIDNIFNKYSLKKSSSKSEEFQFENFEEFYDWFIEKTKHGNKCCYCGVNQDELNNLKIAKNPMNRLKRETRGKTLEIERIISYPNEKNIYSKDNCDFACHVCNNAKSDFISPKEFKYIAKGISIMWKNLGLLPTYNDKNKYWEIEYIYKKES